MNDEPKMNPQDDELVARYGKHLDGLTITHAQQREVLGALWVFMQMCVDAGFSVKPGDKFAPNLAIGMDDVLSYVFATETDQDDPNSGAE